MTVNLTKCDLIRLIGGSTCPDKYINCCLKKRLIKDISKAYDGGPNFVWRYEELEKRNESQLVTIYENIIERKIRVD